LDGVPDGREVDATVGVDSDIEQSNVTLNRVYDAAIPLPESPAAFNVGEEEGDRPPWPVCHHDLLWAS
jgi:hypothetical protein